ncbi:polysaccharide export protein [Pistricoccus aurantiacus]|uniref:Polysaccharide export protein Wza n=1 Tax=Pistricoccus aurantiacus TaxID=1883414 RepID=A0A5B8SRC7_9GAMM|nr:polysaccharide export protein [Pistricoccus aurantiacus]QEA39729.1 polysaccharide export protein Wza [Pistricoccus aurantiacus]
MALAASTLVGCSWAPGSDLKYESEAAPIDELVEFRPITPGLLATYREISRSAASRTNSDLEAAKENYEYQVGKGDILDIIVYDHPELTIPAGSERSAAEAGNQVRNDGTIYYPYIGRVRVVGKTMDEIRAILTRRLSEYIADPQVDVRMADFRSKKVYLSGAVAQPGPLPLTTVPMTIIDAVSQAGGASENANWHNIILTRNGVETPISLYDLMREGDLSQNMLLRDGDVLHIPTSENQSVAVMGQVRIPGNLPLGNERISLTDAIARAGGIDETTAEPSGIFVIRSQEITEDKIATVFQLDVSNAAAFSMGKSFILQPEDVIYVTTAPVARWNRVISLLLPTINLPGAFTGTATDVQDL